MTIRSLILVLAFLPPLTACQSGGDSPALAADRLVGSWDNVLLRLEMPTYQRQSNNTFRLEADPGNYLQVMDMKPIRTIFYENKSFRQEYRKPDDNLFMVHTGHWKIDGGQLIMYIREPAPDTNMYRVDLRGDSAILQSLRDFDLDGEVDDSYYAILVKTKK